MLARPTSAPPRGARGKLRPVRTGGIAAAARGHRALLAVLAVAALVRVATAVTYAPALMWADSWQYLFGTSLPGGFAPDKPNGYMVFLAFMGTGQHLAWVTAVQHVLGLAGGVLVFILLRRLECGRALATLATAVIVLDGYAIALEQHVLAEATFTFALVGWAVVAVAAPRSPPLAAVAGLLLVVAVSLRAVAIFIVPVWIAYGFWGYGGRWARAASVVVVVAGLAGYVTWHQEKVGNRGLNELDGWLLYGRVAEIAECPGRAVRPQDRALCPPASDRPEGWPDPYAFSLFSPTSPLQRELGDLYALPAEQRRAANDRLRAFARDAIADRPVAFAGLLLRDTAKYFIPGVMSALPSFDEPITLPARPRPVSPVAQRARRAFAPDYEPPPRGPAGALPFYQRWIHTPRWLLAVLVAAAAVALGTRLLPRSRQRIEHRPEIFLLTGAGLSLVAGASLSHFEPRYLIPAVPLIVAGGTTAVSDWRNAGRRRSPSDGSGDVGRPGR